MNVRSQSETRPHAHSPPLMSINPIVQAFGVTIVMRIKEPFRFGAVLAMMNILRSCSVLCQCHLFA